MKRWALLTGGTALLIIAAGAFLYDLVAFLLSPPNYKASALISFERREPRIKAYRDSICSRPSFLFTTNILDPVCHSLGLATKWSRRYDLAGLTDRETYALLCARAGLKRGKSE